MSEFQKPKGNNNSIKLKVALSKGRIQDEELELFEKIGIRVNFPQRELKCDTENFIFWLIKPQDVPTWVESGVVDFGVVGLDIIRETKKDVLELMDLQIGKCRFSLASNENKLKGKTEHGKVFIATKFPNLTKEYCAQVFRDFEIIHLHGSVEVAPQVGLADYITDLVSTGRTLKENNLVEVKVFFDSSAYLIANRTSFIVKYDIMVEKFLKILHKSLGKDTFLFQ